MPKKQKKRSERGGPLADLKAPVRMVYSPDHPNQPFIVGLAALQEAAADQPVFLVRRAWHNRVRQGSGLLERIMRRVGPQDISARNLVPGVTVYAARLNLKDGPMLVIADPVSRDWRRE